VRSTIENRTRLTLSTPPALAAENDERRATYIASLLMYEELLGAARAVDYLARPLPLFYALSRAGRAIVAAYGMEPTARGHGLSQGAVRQPITATTIRLGKNGLLQAVAAAFAWPILTGPVELGAVWSALPDLADTPHHAGVWPRALFVWPEPNETGSHRFDGSYAMIPFPDGARGPAD